MTSKRPIPHPGCWARVRLVQGKSKLGIWDVTSEVADARIDVGSSKDVDWPIEHAGVEAKHFQLFWDGRMLWVSPPHHGTLLVDGEPVTDWRQLAGRCRIDFGRAAMLVETSSAAVSSLSETVLVEPLPEGSNVEDFINENDAKTVFFQGTYDFEHGNHQPDSAGETQEQPSKDGSDVRTLLVDPDSVPPVGEVASPFKGGGAPAKTPSKRAARKLETELGSRFARPELSGEFPPSRLQRLLAFRPTKQQTRMSVAIVLALVASLALWSVRARREALVEQQQQIAQTRARQERAQAKIAARASAARQRLEDRQRAVEAELEEFLERRRIRFAELRAREEAIAELRRREPDPRTIPNAMRQERLDLEDQAVALVFSNDLAGALEVYRKLAAAYPDEPAYRSVIEVLTAKLRCVDGTLSTGEPCR